MTGTHWSARLQPVTYDLGLRDMRGALLAFADYDSDNFVDLFIASPTAEESLQAWMWRGDVKDGKFELQRQWRVRGLVGLIPGDFDGNGQLDAVAITTHERCADVGALRMHLCDHSMGCATAVDGSVEEARAALEATALPMDGGAMMSQPLTLDLNGDMRPDLLAMWAPLDDDCRLGKVEARAWLNRWNGPSGFERIHPFMQRLLHNTTAEHAPSNTPRLRACLFGLESVLGRA